jgi:hypothetical protein
MKTTTKKKTSKQVQLNAQSRAQVLANAELLSRAMLAARLGKQFDGDRDLYAAFGYDQTPDIEEYRAHYERQGIATRAVEIFADDTWANPPIIIDGDARSDSLDDGKLTPFLQEFNALSKRVGLWQMMRQVDIMCGIGRYSVLFLGAPGNYNEEAKNGGLFFLAAYDESQATINDWIKDPKTERFGMPSSYTITFNSFTNEPVPPGGNVVHFSRAIHVSENRLGSRVYGRPRLQTVLNRLFDLEKVTGGSAEAVWLSMYKGLAVTGREGTSLPAPDSEEGKFLEEQLQNYTHRMQRYMVLENAELKDMGVDTVSVRDTFDLLMDDLAGSLGIPKRILMGSERGELASSQDARAWDGVIKNRRTNFAEPELVNPFVDWCIAHKVVRPPESGKYRVEWKPVFQLTDIEKADLANKIVQGASTLTGGMPTEALEINEWRSMVSLPALDVDYAALENDNSGQDSQNLNSDANADPSNQTNNLRQ